VEIDPCIRNQDTHPEIEAKSTRNLTIFTVNCWSGQQEDEGDEEQLLHVAAAREARPSGTCSLSLLGWVLPLSLSQRSKKESTYRLYCNLQSA